MLVENLLENGLDLAIALPRQAARLGFGIERFRRSAFDGGRRFGSLGRLRH